ncbi:MAG: SDR family oxidoreductase [Nitrospirales bacterium]|nr:SDR family oxidoreductase [Nitrospira sp.]MDR4501876.1 SDR family oxidoreductase [Nitrospirales bacterium]
MNHRLLVTGGTGYLGSHLIKNSQTWTTHATYFQSTPRRTDSTTFHQCDLTNGEQTTQLITSIKPTLIIHTACSNKSAQEISAIVPAASHLARLARETGSKFIHLSTDLVFDGTSAPYYEEDIPCPLHPYGEAKSAAEQIISTVCPDSIIIRASLMYGIDPYDHQTRWLMQGLESGNPIHLFTDEIRSPIWVENLAKAILELSDISYSGILHLAGPEAFNRWDFGMAILKLVKRHPTSNIQPSTIAASGMIRPKNLALRIEKARKLLKTPFLSVLDVMRQLHGARS